MLVGFVGVLILLGLIFIGVPVAVALFGMGIGGLIYVRGWDLTMSTTGNLLFNAICSYQFAVIPLFIFMGQVGYFSGLLSELFDIAQKWLGRIRGGLAMSVVLANTVFAACSGSSMSAAVVIGKSALPVMKKANYPDSLSTGIIAASGTLAVLIPPSVALCIYGLLVQESIGPLFIAGIIPGIVSASLYILFISITSRGMAAGETTPWRQKLYSLRYLWVIIVLVVAILGGIYLGITTPTEAAAAGTFVMIVLAVIKRRMNWSILRESVVSATIVSGMIMIIIVSALLFTRFLVMSGFSKEVMEAVAAMAVPRYVVFLLITLVYFVIGCFVDTTSMMVMTLPIFYPLVMSLGFDSLWFGIIVVLYCEMAMITPPVGVNLYATQSISGGVPIGTIIRGALPFLIVQFLTVALLYIFPKLATFLPSMM